MVIPVLVAVSLGMVAATAATAVMVMVAVAVAVAALVAMLVMVVLVEHLTETPMGIQPEVLVVVGVLAVALGMNPLVELTTVMLGMALEAVELASLGRATVALAALLTKVAGTITAGGAGAVGLMAQTLIPLLSCVVTAVLTAAAQVELRKIQP